MALCGGVGLWYIGGRVSGISTEGQMLWREAGA